MSSEKASALVLRVTEFSETSSIVTLFTREFGKVRGLAKGARRPKGAFESALDLLALCRIVFLRKSSDSLDLLTEAKLERRFRPPPGNLAALYAGYYVAELLNELTDVGDPHPDLFDAADRALAALGQAAPVRPLVLRFELAALRILGHLPALDGCAECGASVATTGRVPFGLLSGGVLCSRCRAGKKQVVSVSGRVLEVLRHFAATGPDAAVEETIDPAVHGELRGVLNHYWTHLVGHPLQMHQYLGATNG